MKGAVFTGKYILKFKMNVVKYCLSKQASFIDTTYFALNRSMIREWRIFISNSLRS